MDGVFDIKVVGVSLLEEASRSIGSFAQRCGFPAVERSGGLDLEDLGSVFLVMASDYKTNTERSDTSRLSILLEELSDLFAEHEWGDVVPVLGVIDLHIFSCLHQDGAEVGTDTRVCAAHVLAKGLNFMNRSLVDKRRHQLLLTGNDAAVLGLDAEARFPISDCL